MHWAVIDKALSDPSFFVDHDPHALWQQLRRDDPIHWTEGSGRPFWSITRYDDIIAVVSEPTRFSSGYLLAIPSSIRRSRTFCLNIARSCRPRSRRFCHGRVR
jgi:cytochrome P450